MAKRRGSKKRKGGHRRSRVGAVHPKLMAIATKAAGVVAGAVGAAFVNSAIKKSMPTAPAFTGGALAALGGVALPYFMSGNRFVEGVGDGMIAAGGLFILNETFLSIPGVSGLPMMPGKGFVNQTVGRPMRRISGLDNLKTVGSLIDN